MQKPHLTVDRRKTGNTHGAHKPRGIVLHSTECGDRQGASDITGVLAFLERTADQLGVHFCVDAEGLVGQGAPLRRVTYHCAGHNTGYIGIEMIGFARFSLKTWLTRRRQLRKVARLIAYMSISFDIPIRHSVGSGVCLHRDVPAGGHWDPGYHFPLRRVLRMARRMKAAARER